MVQELLYLLAISSLCSIFFITNSQNLIINGVVMEALLGIDHLSLKKHPLWEKNIALSVEDTSASVRISSGSLRGVFKTQENSFFFMNVIKKTIHFLCVDEIKKELSHLYHYPASAL